jgi:Domain of unknown function (DUF4864)
MELTTADRKTIRWVVERQLEALQRDDAIGAFAFASPDIQEQFGTAEQFMAMVKSAYAPVHRPRSVIFENIIAVEGYPAQKVLLMAPEGELITALYLMEKQVDATWRIQGCFLMPIEGKIFDE